MNKEEADNLSPEVIRTLLDSASSRSWAGLHRAVHAELERPEGPRFEENVLNDIVAVARLKDEEGEEFPGDFEDLVATINRTDKALPHQ